jgi:hypothetical protein
MGGYMSDIECTRASFTLDQHTVLQILPRKTLPSGLLHKVVRSPGPPDTWMLLTEVSARDLIAI